MRKAVLLLLFLSLLGCKVGFQKQTPEPQMPEFRTAKGEECGLRAQEANSACVEGCSSLMTKGRSSLHTGSEIQGCVYKCNKKLEERYERCFEEDKKR
jgi:hypothetical protein